jgi:hypothetical protein
MGKGQKSLKNNKLTQNDLKESLKIFSKKCLELKNKLYLCTPN